MIRLDRLSLSFGQRPILTNISFEIRRGETLALVGESGGGKTSLARLLLGLVPGRRTESRDSRRPQATGFHWSGAAWVGDLDVLRAGAAQMRAFRGREIGLIVQALSDALNPHLTVKQHMQEMLNARRRRGVDAREACLAHNIPEELHDRFPAKLSGGEIQRILTALALVSRPRYLVLDEPTASLDPVNKERAINAFTAGREERSQLLITHDLDLASRLADHLGVLHRGQLVEMGPTDEVLDNPTHPYTQALTGIDASAGNRHGRTIFVCTDLLPEADAGFLPGRLQTPVLREGLQVLKLSHRVNGQPVLREVSVFAPPGTCLAVLGASGCGKSTFARLLTGFDQAQAGTIVWFDETSLKKDRRGHPGGGGLAEPLPSALVSQHPHRAMAPHFSVADVLREALRLTKRTYSDTRTCIQERIDALLLQVGLPTDPDFLDRRTAVLSGGEAQRLAIARALATRPRFIVVDEPTSALDMCARVQVLNLLNALKRKEAMTLVIFTHDMDAVFHLADCAFRLESGRLERFPIP